MIDDGSFVLLNHLEEKLTNKEAVERISSHFAKISQQYPPLDTQSLPQHVQDKLAEGAHLFGRRPQIEEYEVYDELMKAKKPKTGIPGDLPRCLVKEFSPELSVPLVKIYNQIISTGVWPEPWRVEHGIPLQKKTNPENEDDLRIISLTSFYSKVFEKFVMDWLLDYIGHLIDWHQYGGQKGNGVTHYLIDFINFIKYNQDLKSMHAVLAVAIDFSKAFNRQNHNILVTLLSDLGIPGWLLNW